MDTKAVKDLEVNESSTHIRNNDIKKTPVKKKLRDDNKSSFSANNQNQRMKTRTRRYRNANKSVARFRLVIRLLPPNLTQEHFYETILTLVNEGYLKQNIEERYYSPGHYSKNPFKLPTYSRGYFTFYDMDTLQTFAKKISTVKFVDDRDNAMVPTMLITPFTKKLVTEESKGMSRSKAKLEGTLGNDKVFQTFLKSWQLMEQDKEKYRYSELSVISSLEKGLHKEKELKERIRKQSEKAIIELAGDLRKEKKSKKKNKKQKKKNVTDEAAPEKKKSKKKKPRVPAEEDKKNVVIIEAAGRRELLRRERLKKKAEKNDKQALSNEKKNTPVKANKSKASEEDKLKKQERRPKTAKKSKKPKPQKKDDGKEPKKECNNKPDNDKNKIKPKLKIKVLQKPDDTTA